MEKNSLKMHFDRRHCHDSLSHAFGNQRGSSILTVQLNPTLIVKSNDNLQQFCLDGVIKVEVAMLVQLVLKVKVEVADVGTTVNLSVFPFSDSILLRGMSTRCLMKLSNFLTN